MEANLLAPSLKELVLEFPKWTDQCIVDMSLYMKLLPGAP